MTGIWTLAGLTIKEAIRRKVFVGALLIALLFVVWAALPIRVHTGTMMGDDLATARDTTGRVVAWLGCGMIKFFGSVLAVTLAAGAITSEIENGVLSTVVPKPISRPTIYLGKWLGLVILLAASILVWSLLLVGVIWHHTHTFHPQIFLGLLATFLFPLLFVTLTLCFSSFANYGLSAALSLIAAGVALAEDMLFFLSRLLDAPILQTLSTIVGYIVPLGKMNHWITRGLGSAGFDLSAFGPRGAGDSAVATSYWELAYICAYIAGSLIVGLIIFQKRDI